MQSIASILNFPDGTPIDAVQGRITAVYPSKTFAGRNGPATVQNAELSDIAGNKIKLVVWEHPDLGPLKDKEFVLHNTSQKKAYPGLQIQIGSFVAKKDGKSHKAGDTVKTFELKVTKEGCFQHIEVYNQNKPAGSPAATPPAATERAPEARSGGQVGGSAQTGYINGASVGMAVNNAVKIICDIEGYVPETFAKQLFTIASDIIRVSRHMENGNLAPKAEAAPAKTTAVAYSAPTPDAGPDEDVPF